MKEIFWEIEVTLKPGHKYSRLRREGESRWLVREDHHWTHNQIREAEGLP
jgi:hypothetical protein